MFKFNHNFEMPRYTIADPSIHPDIDQLRKIIATGNVQQYEGSKFASVRQKFNEYWDNLKQKTSEDFSCPWPDKNYSLLHYAADFPNILMFHAVARKVGYNYCNVQAGSEDEEGFTPIHIAMKRAHNNHENNVVIIRMLQKSDLKIVDKNGDTYLHHAIINGCADEIVKEIIALEPDLIHQANNKRETPLGICLSSIDAIIDSEKEVVKNSVDRAKEELAVFESDSGIRKGYKKTFASSYQGFLNLLPALEIRGEVCTELKDDFDKLKQIFDGPADKDFKQTFRELATVLASHYIENIPRFLPYTEKSLKKSGDEIKGFYRSLSLVSAASSATILVKNGAKTLKSETSNAREAPCEADSVPASAVQRPEASSFFENHRTI